MREMPKIEIKNQTAFYWDNGICYAVTWEGADEGANPSNEAIAVARLKADFKERHKND